MKVDDIKNALAPVFNSTPDVKTYGNNNQVRITTGYKIEENNADVDNEVDEFGLYRHGLFRSVMELKTNELYLAC